MSEFDPNLKQIPVDGNENECKCSKKNKITKDIVDYIEIFVFSICFVMLIFSFLFRVCTVEGPSMENTLLEGENLIVTDVFYTPQRGDIIVFHDTNTLNRPVVKRVIATAGESVKVTYSLTSMTVQITKVDGTTEILEEPYTEYDFPNYAPKDYGVVPEGKIFVMGDNRSYSMDSRDDDIGFVDDRSILGKVVFRLTPFSRIGLVK